MLDVVPLTVNAADAVSVRALTMVGNREAATASAV